MWSSPSEPQQPTPTANRTGRFARWAPFLLSALLAHLALAPVVLGMVAAFRLNELAQQAAIAPAPHPVEVTLDAASLAEMVFPDDPVKEEEEKPKPEEPEEEPEVRPDGQIVEIARPLVEERPDQSEYLAEYDQTVLQETRTDSFRINPDVVSPMYSPDDAMQQEDLVDLHIDKPSTGAQTGNDRFDPDRDGNMAALPSPHAVSNKEGFEDPVPASHSQSKMAGAPQNDLLNEALGDRVALNTREYQYAGYLDRIRRAVNFYWEQNLDNLGSNVIMAKSAYTTGISVVLDSNGALDAIEVTEPSGQPEFDEAAAVAFRLAGPFPNPPDGLIEKDNRVYLPHFTFTVREGAPRMEYQGVDPRAGVQFPGILKSPR